jgi:putative FmdB family regulatory protein
MPIYAYRCADCDHELDALQKISDPPLTDCPACGAAALEKQITAAAFRLKGSGWYETDFKGDKDKRKNLHQDGEPAKDKDAKGEKPKEKAAADAKGKDAKGTKDSSATPPPKPKPASATAAARS